MRRALGSILGATILSASISISCAEDPKTLQQTYLDATIRSIDEVVDLSSIPTPTDEIAWQREFNQTSTRYVQLYFDQIRSGTNDYTVRILRIPSEQPIASYPAPLFAATTEFLTDLLPPERLQVQLVAPPGSKPDLSFRLVQVMWQARPGENATPQSLVPSWDPVRSLPPNDPVATWALSVAMLHIGPREVACTGVLIDPTTVATNYHCIENSLQFLKSENAEKHLCDDVIVEFDYWFSENRGVSTKCNAVRVKKELDVALLTVDASAIRRSSGEARSPVQLRPVTEPLTGNLNIIHHPEGLPASYQKLCHFREVINNEVLHDCDTTSGSSGSPLFDEQMRWVGLHYKGPYPNNWTIQMVLQHIKDHGPTYNRAKMSSEIVTFAQAGR
jgi:V8-like Glu-specific endopeptidase